ncbi:hypothetical protein [Halalkalicoccus tibetensis]|uniref:Phage protein n=1 Tax=Halalkalicoccus tibetensis TaxID=175632 RepID=A0ABD5V342_9EURY
MTQEPTTQSNIFEGIGVVVALLSICASHYQMKTKQESTERQIRELQKKRLQPEYEERVEIIDNSIAKASQNIECLTGKGFTGNIDTIFELENIEPYHQNISKKITQNLLIAWVNIENYSGS